MKTILLLAAAALSFVACTANLRSGLEADLRKRAAFELQCPEAQMTLAPLADLSPGTDAPKSEGVSGCGKQAVYVYAWQQGAYVKNSESEAKR